MSTIAQPDLDRLQSTTAGDKRALHVIIATLGSHGDVHPFVGLGRALRQRGHRVSLCANGHFEDLIVQAGLDFAPIGTAEDFERLTDDPEIWHPSRGWKAIFLGGVFPAMQQTYDAVASRLDDTPTIIVASSLAFGARALGEERGVPVLSVHLSPLVFRSYQKTPKFPGLHLPAWLPAGVKRWFFGVADRRVIDPVLAPPINAFRAKHGLGKIDRPVMEWIHSADGVIGLFPDWFAAPQTDWPRDTRLTGFPLYDESDHQQLPEALSAFLAAGKPPIAFTPGSAMKQGKQFFAASAQACQRLGRRGLLMTRHASQIPADLPPEVLHVPFAPFGLLLPRCAALVHHGGIGTAAQGLAAGIPQLIMPLSHDQPDNAQRLISLGVADEISPRRYSARSATKKLDRLLNSPAVARACRDAAMRMKKMQPLTQTCQIIEERAARHAAPLPNRASRP